MKCTLQSSIYLLDYTIMKFIYLISATILLNFSFSQCQGDSNLDDIVNVNDIILVVNHILEEDSLIGEAFTNSDLNNDSNIDIFDIVIIIELILYENYQCDDNIAIDLSLDWEIQDDLS